MTGAPEPPDGRGDDLPELANIIVATLRLLADLNALDPWEELTPDHRLRIAALLAAVRRFTGAAADNP